MAGLYQISVRVLRYDTIKTNIINKTSSTLTQKNDFYKARSGHLQGYCFKTK